MAVGAYILCNGKKLDDKFHLQYVDVSAEVNKVPIAELGLKDGNIGKQEFPVSDDTSFEPGSTLEVRLLFHDSKGGKFLEANAITVFKGIVTRQTLSASREKTQLIVEARHEVVKMTHNRKNFVWLNKKQTDKEILTQVFKNAKVKGMKFVGAAKFSPQPEMVQNYCTDWDFVMSRCEANGLMVIPHIKGVNIVPFDDAKSGVEEFEIVEDQILDFDFEVTNDYQYKTVNGTGWNPKTQAPVTAAAPAAGKKGKLGNLDPTKIAKTTGGDKFILNSTIATKKELSQWADGKQTKAKLAMLKGRISVRGTPKLEVGQIVKFKGLGKRFEGQTMITGLRHRANIGTWRTDIQFGAPGCWHAHKPEVMERPASGLLPGTNGLQIGIVQEFTKDKSGLVRVKVLVPALKAGKSKGFVWARLGTAYAGEKVGGGMVRGLLFWPEKNDEVILGFFNDDPRYPVILGSMFSKAAQLPLKVDKANSLKGIVSAKNLKLQFDDKNEALSLDTKDFSIIIDQKKGSLSLLDNKSKNKVIMDAKGILLDSPKDITLKSGGSLKIDAGKGVEIKAPKVETK